MTVLHDIGLTVAVLFWIWVFYRFDKWRDRREPPTPRPGRLERRPNGSNLAPWGAEPRVGDVKRAYYGIRRIQRLTHSKSVLPRRPL